MNDKKRNKHDQAIGDIIDKMFKAYGLSDKMKEMEIVNGWEDLMGKAVANRTDKVFISNKVLHVKLNSSVMRDELSYGKKVIIERVNERAGEQLITDVWLD